MRENILSPDDVDATTVNSGNSRGSSSRSSSRPAANNPRPQQPERHDHRKAAFRSGLSPQAGTTQRIWGHIRMQGADAAAQAKASDQDPTTAAGGGRQDKEDEGRGLLAAPFPHPVSGPSLDDLETMGSIDPGAAARLAARERRERKGQGRRSDRRRDSDSDSDTEDEAEAAAEAEAGGKVSPAECKAEGKEAGAVVPPAAAAAATTATAVSVSTAAVAAPPRRAKDLMADPAARAQRLSIDELLAQRDSKRSSQDDLSESDRNEALLDLQLAKLRYSLLSPEDGEHDSKHEAPVPVATSRPPRPPAGSTSPNARPTEKTSSPAGLPIDPNFATESWDQDSSGFGDSPPVRRIVRASDKRAAGGIDPDANWLADDFDK